MNTRRLAAPGALVFTSLALALFASALPAAASDPLRIDDATGADARNYPNDLQADFLHMRLEIDIPDMNTPRFIADETIQFTPIGAPMSVLRLDAKRLTIDHVSLASSGQTPKWSSDGMVVQFKFDPPLAPGVPQSLRIQYTLENPVEGLYWSPARSEKPGRPARAAQIHSQGEADMNSNWFICHDFPNDKLTTELIVTVPGSFLVSSNGQLVLKQNRGDRTTFHWKQDKPHSSYLVTLIVGKFDVVDVGDDQLSLPVYVPRGKGDLVEQSYRRVSDMIHVFEDRLDEPYPWARYAQLLVWNFGFGGMENTAATTLYGTAVLDSKALQDADMDGLVSHELGHQWFGDLLTCNSWEHIWLNEGFATYMEALWFEARDGFDNGYLLDMYRNIRSIAERDQIDADDAHDWSRPAVVSKLFADPDDVFSRQSNPYPKGASIVHMLRMKLGDDVFFKGIQTYVERFKFKTVETSDFRRVMEEVSGLSLEQFFDQWAYRPGTPKLTISSDWDYETNELHLVVEQTHRIDAMTPAYRFDLPILIVGETGEQTWTTVAISGRRHERTVSLASAPSMVVTDPYMHVLMTPTVEQPVGQIIAQLGRGPTIASRLDAAEFLKSHAGSATLAALTDSLNNLDEQVAVRSAAAQALGELTATHELLETLDAGIADARVRLAVIRALDEIGTEAVVPALAASASNPDESYAVRASALAALGEHSDESHLPILLAAINDESQHDQVRQGALRGLANLGDAAGIAGLNAALGFTEIGWMARTRAVAVRAVARLADADKDHAIETLVQLLTDPEERTATTAGAGLVKIGDADALDKMRHVAKTHPNPKYRKTLNEQADQLADRLKND